MSGVTIFKLPSAFSASGHTHTHAATTGQTATDHHTAAVLADGTQALTADWNTGNVGKVTFGDIVTISHPAGAGKVLTLQDTDNGLVDLSVLSAADPMLSISGRLRVTGDAIEFTTSGTGIKFGSGGGLITLNSNGLVLNDNAFLVWGTQHGLDIQNINNSASNEVGRFRSGNTGGNDNDEGFFSFFNDDSAGTQVEFSRLSWKALDVTNTTKDSQFEFAVQKDDTLTDVLLLGAIATTLTADTIALTGELTVTGDTTLEDSGAVPYALMTDDVFSWGDTAALLTSTMFRYLINRTVGNFNGIDLVFTVTNNANDQTYTLFDASGTITNTTRTGTTIQGLNFRPTVTGGTIAAFTAVEIFPRIASAPVVTISRYLHLDTSAFLKIPGVGSTDIIGIDMADIGHANWANVYGMRIADLTAGGTLTRPISQEGTTGHNVLAANTSIGTTTAPIATLDINGGLAMATVAKTGAYTTTSSDHVITCDASGGAFTVTLPAASGVSGIIYHIKKTDSSVNAVTVDGNASETIDGATTAALSAQFESIMISCDGSNWHII